MIYNVSMFEFIKAVFKFDWDGIPPKSCEYQYKLSLSDVQTMLEAPTDEETYDATPKVSNRLLSHLYGYDAGSKPARLRCAPTCRMEFNGDRKVPMRTYRGWMGARATEGISKHRLREKSDMTYYEVKETTKPDLKWAMLPLEAEKTLNMSARKLPVDDVLGKRVNGTLMGPVCPLFLKTLHIGVGR